MTKLFKTFHSDIKCKKNIVNSFYFTILIEFIPGFLLYCKFVKLPIKV